VSEKERRNLIKEILEFEHRKTAERLNFIEPNGQEIPLQTVHRAVGLLDDLSRNGDDESKNVVVTISAILWIYRSPKWSNIGEFLILVLSRIGYSPSSFLFDPAFDFKSGKYSGMNSLINQISVALNHLKFQVSIQEKIFLLTSFQHNIWEKIEKYKTIGISAPTSAGKSFVIALKSVSLLLKEEGAILYIVPTLSLVSQVSIDFRKLLKKFELNDYEILNTYNGEYTDSRKIFVLTQEKAIGAFSQSSIPFKHVRMLVIDEIQNVERVADENDQRAKTLFDLIVEFRHSTTPFRTVISGPRIEKIGDLGAKVFGEETEQEETSSSPVAGITYSISKTSIGYVFKQYSDILELPLSLVIVNDDKISGIGKKLYKPDFHAYLSNLIRDLGTDSKNIIFSPKADQARKTAVALAENKNEKVQNLDSLISYLGSTVHKNYDLCKTLKNGFAYHHGKLPHHVRRVLEKAISEKMINNVVCTTTLMQGVNLPAQNVIIRNPNLFLTKRFGEPRLTGYEIANLRGRAGRLLKDCLGRTFILDEKAFEVEGEEQQDLFSEQTKEIKTGYGDVYKSNSRSIETALINNEPPGEDNKEYGFLLTYIRQTILKHDENAIMRLRSTDIEIGRDVFQKIKDSLKQISVPLSVCLKNRYWDPIDLNRLYLTRNRFALPTSASESGIALSLKKALIELKSNFKNHVDKYFKITEIPNIDLLYSACINAEDWLKEKPLQQILNTEYHDKPDHIEDTIALLQNKISFGLPMLLKPIYDINHPDSAFLRFVEQGAFRPVTRRLCEYNIPRETAIHLTNRYFNGLDVKSDNFDRVIISTLKNDVSKMNYWTQVQLEVLI
jgi:hypothetical protein